MSDKVVELVDANIDSAHPTVVRNQLVMQARKLLREKIDPDLIAAALKEWDKSPDMGFGMLPYLVSDVIRRRRPPELDWEKKLAEEMSA